MDEKRDTKGFYANKPDPGMTAGGEIEYHDMIGQGLETLTLPAPPWEESRGRTTESITAKNLPRHIASQIERSIQTNAFYGKKPEEIMGWYIGSLKGLGLIDNPTGKRLDKLASGLEGAQDQAEYFKAEIAPFLDSLRPKSR